MRLFDWPPAEMQREKLPFDSLGVTTGLTKSQEGRQQLSEQGKLINVKNKMLFTYKDGGQ